ncbi:hypothetical protein ACFX13_018914 [Malus domestica]
MLIFLKLCISPMSSGSILMLKQSDTSRKSTFPRFFIEVGSFDSSVHDLSLNISKFSNLPIPSGKADSL